MSFPATRLRRLRRSDRLRALVRETRLDLDDFVFPLFVGPRTEPNASNRSIKISRTLTGMIIAIGFAQFGLAVKYLPIFPKEAVVPEQVHEPESALAVGSAVLEHAGD